MAVLIGHASCDENGKATGGTGGDQNGNGEFLNFHIRSSSMVIAI